MFSHFYIYIYIGDIDVLWNNLNKENGDVTHWNGGLTGNRSNLLQLKFGLVKQLGMLPNGDFVEKYDRLW